MTRDRETAEAELVWAAARAEWDETGAPVTVAAVAARSGIEEPSVRRWLAEAEGAEYEVAQPR